MADELTLREAARWQEMKILRAQGLDFWEWVKPLHELGLLECRNCRAGVSNTRITSRGDDVCRTCEGTVTQFWRRNLKRLGADEATILEVKGEWIEAHQFIAQTCRRNAITIDDATTERTATELHAETVDGKQVTREVPVTTRTVRRQRKVNITALRLLAEVNDKLAKMGGLDVSTVDSATPPPPRTKQHVHRLDPGAEPEPN